jgi:hypothetical protein
MAESCSCDWIGVVAIGRSVRPGGDYGISLFDYKLAFALDECNRNVAFYE